MDANQRHQTLQTFTIQFCRENQVDFEKGWNCLDTYGIQPLKNILQSILRNEFPDECSHSSNSSHSLLYSISFYLCNNGSVDYSEKIYEKIKENCELFSTELGECSTLEQFSQQWKIYNMFVHWMYKTFTFVDKGFVHTKQKETITSVSLKYFVENIFEINKLSLTNQMLENIQLERIHQLSDSTILRQCITIYKLLGIVQTKKNILSVKTITCVPNELSIYENELETHFLKSSFDYFTSLSEEFKTKYDVKTYLQKANECMENEFNLIRKLLHETTKSKMQKIMSECFVVNQREYLI